MLRKHRPAAFVGDPVRPRYLPALAGEDDVIVFEGLVRHLPFFGSNRPFDGAASRRFFDIEVPRHCASLTCSALGRKSSADNSTPFSFAAASNAGTCLKGIIPPVPPLSFSRFQLETRVRCTPAISATLLGPPNVRMIVLAGSMDNSCSDSRNALQAKCSDHGNILVANPSLQLRHV